MQQLGACVAVTRVCSSQFQAPLGAPQLSGVLSAEFAGRNVQPNDNAYAWRWRWKQQTAHDTEESAGYARDLHMEQLGASVLRLRQNLLVTMSSAAGRTSVVWRPECEVLPGAKCSPIQHLLLEVEVGTTNCP
jgi:hypothetical protein